MARTKVNSALKNSSRDDVPTIWFYKGVGVTRDDFDDIFYWYDYAYSELYNGDRIPGYAIRAYTCDFDRTDYPNSDTMVGALEEWCKDNGYTSDGVHFVYHDQSSGAAGTVTGPGWTQFQTGHTRTSGSWREDGESAIHETFHSFVDQSLVGDLIEDNEHDLGRNFTDESLNIVYETPFALQGAVERGTCDASTTNDSWTWEPTRCSGKGMDRTHDDVF